MKRIKKIMISIVFCAVVIVATSAVSAASYPFSVEVTKISDGETSLQQKKEGYGHASMIVSGNTNSEGVYEAWIEKSTGTNVSNTAVFSGHGASVMTYNKPGYITEAYKAKLNISTSLTNFSKASISGTWDPNAG